MTRFIVLAALCLASVLAGEIGDADFPVVEQAPADNVVEPPKTLFKPPKTLVNKPKPSVDTDEDRTVVEKANKTKDRAGFDPYAPHHNNYKADSCQSIRYHDKCYFVAKSQESWHTGRDYCKRIGYTLARIESSDEATFLASYLKDNKYRNYWIDLNDEHTEGVWTNSDGGVGFTDWWAPREPNGNRGENCGLLVIGHDSIGRLVDEPCGEWRRYICERRSESVCYRAGYRNQCYWFSIQVGTWGHARDYCAAMGKRLARVTSMDETKFLARTMPGTDTWVDLRHGGQGSRNHGHARPGMMAPTLQCPSVVKGRNHEGNTMNSPCYQRKRFVCESKPMPPGSEDYPPEEMDGSMFGSSIGVGGGVGSNVGGPVVGGVAPVNPNVYPAVGGGYGAGMGGGMVGGMAGGMVGGMGPMYG